MQKSEMEKRIVALEEEVAHLRTAMDKNQGQGWKAFVGAFLHDPYFKKAMDIGRRYRESLKPKAKKKSKRRNGHS
ncbi:MAG: hypothetical protein U0793_04900 [Gemmataceae bacterium]